ncbi:MAG: hypothetical protein ACXAB7_22150, partial [Candidatus Kariarchaeaceae archaeon]
MQTLPHLISNLRQLGFPISISEQIEAHQLLKQVDNTAEVRLGLRMLLCQSRKEQELFDLVWQSYHYPSINHADILDTDATDGHPPTFPIAMDGGGDAADALIQFGSALKGVARQLLQGNERNAGAILLRYLLAGSYSVGELQERRDEATAEVASMLQTVAPNAAPALLRQLQQELDAQLQERLQNPMDLGKNPLMIQQIEDIPLLHLDPSPELHLALRRLGRRLATRHKRKLRKGRKKINL